MEEEMEYTMDLNKRMAGRFFKKYLFGIVLFGILVGSIGVFAKLKLSPVEYTSQESLVQSDGNHGLISSYEQFVTSEKFTKVLNSEIDHGKWKNKDTRKEYEVTITQQGTSSPFFTIGVTTDDPAYTRYLTTLSSHVFMANIGKYLTGANVSVVLTASTAQKVNSLSDLIHVGLESLGIGLVVAIIWSIFHMLLVGRLTDEYYIRDIYQVGLLGTLDKSNN